MNNLNSAIIEGVAGDVKYQELSGKPFLSFIVGVNRSYKEGNDIKHYVSLFTVEAYGKLAEVCKSLANDADVRVVGRLHQNRWEDKSGRKHSKVVLIAEHIEYVPGKNGGKA